MGDNLLNELVNELEVQTQQHPHVGESASVTQWQCNYCGKQFKKRHGLVNHIKMHEDKKPFKCDHCGEQYTSQEELAAHVSFHSYYGPLTCHFCEKKFEDNKKYLNHLNFHRKKKFPCRYCTLNFDKSVDLKSHYMDHPQAIIECRCEICDKTFLNNALQIKHMQSHYDNSNSKHGNAIKDRRTYECDVCLKVFANVKRYNIHKARHAGIKVYSCGACKLQFLSEKELEKHKVVHSKEREFACERCDRKFTYKGGLRAHMRCHAGIKSYKCKSCDKAFILRDSLLKHTKRVHDNTESRTKEIEKSRREAEERDADNKPFLCHICRKRFVTMGERKSHLRLHWNEISDAPVGLRPGLRKT